MPIRSKLFYLYIAFAVLYAISFLTPRSIGNIEHFDLTTTQYRLLSLTVLLPTVAIWYAAFYGYSKLRSYVALIHNTPDGKHVARLTAGILFLVLGLPTSTMIGVGCNLLAQEHPSLVAAAAIVRTYSSLIFPLVGFLLISQGARGLSELAKQRPSFRAVNILAAVFIAIGVFYVYIMLGRDLAGIYHMPEWLALATVVGPYLYMWYVGMLAAYEVHLYSRMAPGVIYRKTWNVLASAIAAIIVIQMGRQYVGVVTSQLDDLHLARLLVMVYVFLVGLSIGYVLLAVGAKKLRKIEEV